MLNHHSNATVPMSTIMPQVGFTALEESFFASEVLLDETEDFYRAPLLSRLATHIADFVDSKRLPVRQ